MAKSVVDYSDRSGRPGGVATRRGGLRVNHELLIFSGSVQVACDCFGGSGEWQLSGGTSPSDWRNHLESPTAKRSQLRFTGSSHFSRKLAINCCRDRIDQKL